MADPMAPSLASQNLSLKNKDDSWLHLPKKRSNLHIVGDIPIDKCPYWISLAPGGELTPAQILGENTSLQEAILSVSHSGLCDKKPLMIANAVGSHPEFIYLVPTENLPQMVDAEEWVEALALTIQSWNPEAIGLYLSDKLIDRERNFFIQKELIRILIQRCEGINFYLLKGSIEYNHLINFALSIRESLLNQEIDLFVNH